MPISFELTKNSVLAREHFNTIARCIEVVTTEAVDRHPDPPLVQVTR